MATKPSATDLEADKAKADAENEEANQRHGTSKEEERTIIERQEINRLKEQQAQRHDHCEIGQRYNPSIRSTWHTLGSSALLL